MGALVSVAQFGATLPQLVMLEGLIQFELIEPEGLFVLFVPPVVVIVPEVSGFVFATPDPFAVGNPELAQFTVDAAPSSLYTFKLVATVVDVPG
jgi:hypothetical protein